MIDYRYNALAVFGNQSPAAAEKAAPSSPTAAQIGWRIGVQQHTFRRFTFHEMRDMMVALGIERAEGAFFLPLDKACPELKTGEEHSSELRKKLKRQGFRGVAFIENEHDSEALMADAAECVAFAEKTAQGIAAQRSASRNAPARYEPGCTALVTMKCATTARRCAVMRAFNEASNSEPRIATLRGARRQSLSGCKQFAAAVCVEIGDTHVEGSDAATFPAGFGGRRGGCFFPHDPTRFGIGAGRPACAERTDRRRHDRARQADPGR